MESVPPINWFLKFPLILWLLEAFELMQRQGILQPCWITKGELERNPVVDMKSGAIFTEVGTQEILAKMICLGSFSV